MYINGKDENYDISIHAPRGGSDNRRQLLQPHQAISIHAPRGGSDTGTPIPEQLTDQFQSTLPVGGATPSVRLLPYISIFQSTLPVGGATQTVEFYQLSFSYFNPRSPWGERRGL